MSKYYYQPEYRKGATLLIRNVPLDLRMQFKVWCTRRGTSMNKKLIELINQTVKDEVHTNEVKEKP